MPLEVGGGEEGEREKSCAPLPATSEEKRRTRPPRPPTMPEKEEERKVEELAEADVVVGVAAPLESGE